MVNYEWSFFAGSAIFIIMFLFQMVFTIAIWVFVFKFIMTVFKKVANNKPFENASVLKETVNNTYNKYQRTYTDVPSSKLAKFNTDDINSLKAYFYKMFVDFEKAYNSLDYNTMKVLTTKQLYQNYYTGITLDTEEGKKKHITDITKKNVIIYELDSTISKQIASVMIEISYVNYTTDKNGSIVRGSKDKIVEKFEVEFRKDFIASVGETYECQGCGATFTGNRCNYCRAHVEDRKFKISSIKRVID